MTIKTILIPSLRTLFSSKWSWLLALLTVTPFTIQSEGKLIINVIVALGDPQSYFWLFSRLQLGTFSFSNVLETTAKAPIGILSLIVAGILVITVLFFIAWVVVNAQGILIFTHAVENRGKTFSFTNALNTIERSWLTLLELNLILVIARILAISLLLIATVILSSWTLSFLGIIIMVATFIALTFLSFTIRISLFKTVLERKDIKTSLKEAIAFVKERIVECYELSFILYAFTLIVYTILITIFYSIFSPDELRETVILSLFLKGGIVPFLVLAISLIVFALVTGYLALLQYTTWLTWYTEATKKSFNNSYVKRFVKRMSSYVKRSTVN